MSSVDVHCDGSYLGASLERNREGENLTASVNGPEDPQSLAEQSRRVGGVCGNNERIAAFRQSAEGSYIVLSELQTQCLHASCKQVVWTDEHSMHVNAVTMNYTTKRFTVATVT